MDRPLEDIVFDRSVPVAEKRRAARAWLDGWKRSLLPELRTFSFSKSKYADRVTLIIYFFMPTEETFDLFEFSVLKSWATLGRLPTTIVVDRVTDTVERFRTKHPECVRIVVEKNLVVGDIRSMTEDCVERLYTRFDTDYCLIVQDDGFPVLDRMDEFLGRYDYIGAPSVRDVPAQYWVDITRCACMNGGFSLRSRKICCDVAQQWRFWKKHIPRTSCLYSEDVIYSQVCCRNPFFRLRNRFPSSKIARRFSLPDFDGVVDIRSENCVPMGVHGPTAIWQLAQRGITV